MPAYPSPTSQSLEHAAVALAEFIHANQPLLVLTGAGISTASGIPDYRDANGNWKHAKPVQYREFMDQPQVYKRYWARSSIGWPVMRGATPNLAHQTLRALEQQNVIGHLITQNVDSLHQKAGHQQVVNMHGHLATVSCQACKAQQERDVLQQRIEAINAAWFAAYRELESTRTATLKPDGDIDLEDQLYQAFEPPFCEHCSGQLKPDVVFFGETIPTHTTQSVQELTNSHRGLLVIGSSLTVFSGFRIARDFNRRDLPLAIVNKGITRADDLNPLKFQTDICALLTATHATIMAPPASCAT